MKISDWWYKKCKSNKVCDWIDDNILWYIWDKPKSAYRTMYHWFYCNFNKYHWRLIKQAFVTYPWDGGFILELEEQVLMSIWISKQLTGNARPRPMVCWMRVEPFKDFRFCIIVFHVQNYIKSLRLWQLEKLTEEGTRYILIRIYQGR